MKKLFKLFMPYMYQSHKLLFVHGVARYLHLRGFLRLSAILEGFMLRHYSCALSPLAQISQDVRMGHPIGIVIGAGVIIESDVIIYQNSTVGRKRLDSPGGARIGRGTVIYANSIIVGNIHVGENCVIGAGSFLDHDIPAGTKFVMRN